MAKEPLQKNNKKWQSFVHNEVELYLNSIDFISIALLL